MISAKKIDLACGQAKVADDFFGIDILPGENVDCVMDLNAFPWDIESNSVSEVYCSHYIEHIPHYDIKAVVRQSSNFEEFKSRILGYEDFYKDDFFKF